MKVKGIAYLSESMGWLKKSPQQIRKDIRIIKNELNANVIRLEGYKPLVFEIAKIAQEEGLEVWIQLKFNDVVPISKFLIKSEEFAKKAQELGVTTFILGGELTLELNFENEKTLNYVKKTKDFENNVIKPLQENPTIFQDFMNQLIKKVRKKFTGKIAYSSGTWEFDYVPWDKIDIVMNNQFYWKPTKDRFISLLKEIKQFGKPAIQGECAFQTIDQALDAGPMFLYSKEHKVNYDEETQAECFRKNLNYIKKANLDGVFIHQFDENTIGGGGDLGFGIVKLNGTKKKSFFVISEFFKHWR